MKSLSKRNKVIVLLLCLVLSGPLLFLGGREIARKNSYDRTYEFTEALDAPYRVRKLRVQAHELKKDTLLKFSNLEQLAIHYRTPDLEGSYQKLEFPKGLKSLALIEPARNRIPLNSFHLPDLEELILYCPIKIHEPMAASFHLRKLSKLKVLVIKACFFENLPEGFSELVNLEKFNSNLMSLRKLPSNLSKLKSLSSFRIAGPFSLEQFPKALAELPALRELEIDGYGEKKRRVVIDLAPGSFPVLESLSLRIGFIDGVRGLEGLHSLSHLELPGRLKVIPALPSGLKRLNLSNNRINSIKNVVFPSGLRRLDLSGNNLRSVPDSFSHLHKLRILNLSHNYLREAPKLSPGLSSLELLWLDRNCLRSLSLASDGVPLKSVWLQGNPIKVFPKDLLSFSSLKDMRLPAIRLNTLPAEILKMKSLKVIEFRYLPLEPQELPPFLVSEKKSPPVLDEKGRRLILEEIKISGGKATLGTSYKHRGVLKSLRSLGDSRGCRP